MFKSRVSTHSQQSDCTNSLFPAIRCIQMHKPLKSPKHKNLNHGLTFSKCMFTYFQPYINMCLHIQKGVVVMHFNLCTVVILYLVAPFLLLTYPAAWLQVHTCTCACIVLKYTILADFNIFFYHVQPQAQPGYVHICDHRACVECQYSLIEQDHQHKSSQAAWVQLPEIPNPPQRL